VLRRGVHQRTRPERVRPERARVPGGPLEVDGERWNAYVNRFLRVLR
jgi:hypothetical protein